MTKLTETFPWMSLVIYQREEINHSRPRAPPIDSQTMAKIYTYMPPSGSAYHNSIFSAQQKKSSTIE
jgi:hypothetical protein